MFPQFHKHDYLGPVAIYVPDSAIGAVIGYKGSYVRMLQQYTGTDIKVEQTFFMYPSPNQACLAERIPDINGSSRFGNSKPRTVEEYGNNVAKRAIDEACSAVGALDINNDQDSTRSRVGSSANSEPHRLVSINGRSDTDVLKAAFFIFQRVAEVRNMAIGSVRLHLEFKIPDNVVGPLIGKRGIYIQELIRISRGCDVKVISKKDGHSDANICLFGAFGPCLVVACRIIYLRGMTYAKSSNS